MRSRTIRLFVLLVAFACLVAACEMFLPLDESGSTDNKSDGATDGSATTDGQAAGGEGGTPQDGASSVDASFDSPPSPPFDASGLTSFCGEAGANDVFCVDFDEPDATVADNFFIVGMVKLDTVDASSPPGAGQAHTPIGGQMTATFTSKAFRRPGASKVTLAFDLRLDAPPITPGDPWVLLTLNVGGKLVTFEWKMNFGYYLPGPSLIHSPFSLPLGEWHHLAIIVMPTLTVVDFDFGDDGGQEFNRAATITVDNVDVTAAFGVSGATNNTHDRQMSIDNVRLTIE